MCEEMHTYLASKETKIHFSLSAESDKDFVRYKIQTSWLILFISEYLKLITDI